MSKVHYSITCSVDVPESELNVLLCVFCICMSDCVYVLIKSHTVSHSLTVVNTFTVADMKLIITLQCYVV